MNITRYLEIMNHWAVGMRIVQLWNNNEGEKWHPELHQWWVCSGNDTPKPATTCVTNVLNWKREDRGDRGFAELPLEDSWGLEVHPTLSRLVTAAACVLRFLSYFLELSFYNCLNTLLCPMKRVLLSLTELGKFTLLSCEVSIQEASLSYVSTYCGLSISVTEPEPSEGRRKFFSPVELKLKKKSK